MKNIAIIIPQLTGGGAEKVAANLSHYLNKKYSSHLIVYNDKKVTYDYGGELLCINDDRKFSFFGKIFSVFKRVNSIKRIKSKHNIEATISFLENPNIVNILSKTSDKVIVSVRIYKSKSPNNLYGRINKFLMRALYNKANYIVAVSAVVKEDLVRNFGIKRDKIKVIYNSYDIEHINKLGSEPLEEDLNNFFKGKVITNMGRLEPQKGQAHLIRAFAKVKQEVADAKLLIIGQGSLDKELKQLVQSLELSEDVKFIGYIKNPLKYIKKSKLFVFPSVFEGFPNALCEAMACGVPVISSDCKSGPREILCAETDYFREINEVEYSNYGVLVPVITDEVSTSNAILSKNENILANAISEMLTDEKLRNTYSSRGLERVRDFSVKSIVEKWEEIL